MKTFVKNLGTQQIVFEATTTENTVDFWLLGCNNAASFDVKSGRISFHQLSQKSELAKAIVEACHILIDTPEPEDFVAEDGVVLL